MMFNNKLILMKKIFFIGLFLLVSNFGFSQNVGINNSGAAPDISAMLDIVAADKGLLVPRVNLSGTTDAITVPSPATSLLVYNLATAGVSPNNVVPGYYYNSGTTAAPVWIRLANGNGNAWLTAGNSGTIAATNFLGTIDNIDLVFRTNNIERMRVLGATGYLGVGTNAPTSQIHSVATGVTAVTGNIAAQGSGHLAYNSVFALGSFGSLPSALVFADEAAAGNSPALVSRTLNPASYAAAISFSDVWIAGYYGVDNSSATLNPIALYGQLNVTNTTLGGVQRAVQGLLNRNITGNPGWCTGGYFSAGGAANTEDAIGIMAFGTGPGTGGNPGGGYSTSVNVTGGGYFQANTNWAYVSLASSTARKIWGTGSVSEIISTPEHGRITLTCPESPEYWYQDYGSVKLVNGKAHVDLDPILRDIIVVDEENPIRVFCTPVDMLEFNGVAIMNKTSTGFDIVEINQGQHNGSIDYQIIVKPKTNFGEGRFPYAPPPAFIKSSEEPQSAKTKNIPTYDKVFHWKSDWEVYGYDPAKVTKIGDVVPAGEHAGKIKIAEGVFSDSMPTQKIK